MSNVSTWSVSPGGIHKRLSLGPEIEVCSTRMPPGSIGGILGTRQCTRSRKSGHCSGAQRDSNPNLRQNSGHGGVERGSGDIERSKTGPTQLFEQESSASPADVYRNPRQFHVDVARSISSMSLMTTCIEARFAASASNAAEFSWDVSGVAWSVAAAVAAAEAAAAEAGSGTRRTAAAGNLAWWARREALRTEARARQGWNCCCSWRSGRWRTVGEQRRGEQIMAATWFWRVAEFAFGFFERSPAEEVSKEWRETSVCALLPRVCPKHLPEPALGYPSAGKTTRALQFKAYCESKIADTTADARASRLKVHLINDQTLGVSRAVYHTARAEKDARAEEYSAVKRVLSRDDIVIADGLNYIKGFRYQLYCEAKAVSTPSCVVHIGTPADKCREINTTLLADQDKDGGYEEEDFENLIFRYEEPNGMTRWDSPLFIVVQEDETAWCDQVWDALVGSDGKAKVVRPHQATVLVQLPLRAGQDHLRHHRPDNDVPEGPCWRRGWADPGAGRRTASGATRDANDPAAVAAHPPPVHHHEPIAQLLESTDKGSLRRLPQQRVLALE
ncbi:hypothetical protein OPT61_g5710 [Boeremia exigua]|uniref:Uncharacterized protein n=1 Tax=Boeremia exigua TaxID=749465 RepID=A0ACC2I9E5_9PLEO|nr:hypothetical protein OPT61_g5710 [Boeremia exigua]